MQLSGIRKAIHQANKIRLSPVLLFKIANGYFRTLVMRQNVLRIIEFSINHECQSKCEYCYASNFHKKGEKVLTREEIAQVWKQAQNMGAFSALILGGEPLLRKDFVQVVEDMEPKKNLITFTTNAICFDEEMARTMKRLGVFLVNFSLNSLDPELNDKVRGYDGHFESVMRGIKLCKKYGLDVDIPVTTSKTLMKETMKLIEFAKKEKISVTINLLSPSGSAHGWHGELVDEDFWEELQKMHGDSQWLRNDYNVNFDLKIGCPAGFEKVHIGPYGDVTGCAQQPMSFGNVRDRPLKDIVEEMRRFDHFSKRYPKCLVAMDKEFIGDYVDFAENYSTSPYDIHKNPLYDADGRTAEVRTDESPCV